jgi:hypothetical protein
MLHLHGCRCPDALAGENERLLEGNRALDAKLLAVMMSMHARLGAESGLKVLDDSVVTLICDLFFRDSKASSLLSNSDMLVGRSALALVERRSALALADEWNQGWVEYFSARPWRAPLLNS